MQDAMRVLILPLEDDAIDNEVVDTLLSISAVSKQLAQMLYIGD